MKLFKVQTKSYNLYYVLANDFNEAVSKVENHKKTETHQLIGSDGTLNLPCSDDEIIKEVEFLTDDIIQ